MPINARRTRIIAAVLAAAALAPQPASAHDGWRGGHGGYYRGGCCYRAPNPWPWVGAAVGLGALAGTAAILGGGYGYAPRVYYPPPVVYAAPPVLYAAPPQYYAPAPPGYYPQQPGW